MFKRKGLYNFPQKPCISEQKNCSRILSAMPPQISDIFGKSIVLQITCSKHDQATGGDEKVALLQNSKF